MNISFGKNKNGPIKKVLKATFFPKKNSSQFQLYAENFETTGSSYLDLMGEGAKKSVFKAKASTFMNNFFKILLVPEENKRRFLTLKEIYACFKFMHTHTQQTSTLVAPGVFTTSIKQFLETIYDGEAIIENEKWLKEAKGVKFLSPIFKEIAAFNSLPEISSEREHRHAQYLLYRGLVVLKLVCDEDELFKFLGETPSTEALNVAIQEYELSPQHAFTSKLFLQPTFKQVQIGLLRENPLFRSPPTSNEILLTLSESNQFIPITDDRELTKEEQEEATLLAIETELKNNQIKRHFYGKSEDKVDKAISEALNSSNLELKKKALKSSKTSLEKLAYFAKLQKEEEKKELSTLKDASFSQEPNQVQSNKTIEKAQKPVDIKGGSGGNKQSERAQKPVDIKGGLDNKPLDNSKKPENEKK